LPPEDIRRIAQWLRDRENRRQDERLDTAYSEMALDTERERDALEWSEGVIGDARAIPNEAFLSSVERPPET
jgi:hypothetical protein